MLIRKLSRIVQTFELGKTILIRNSGQYQRPSQLINKTNYKNYDNVRNMVMNLTKKNKNFNFSKIRTDLLKNQKNITEINVDHFIVSMFNEPKDLNFVENYIEYLKAENIDVNIPTVGHLLKLYNLTNESECQLTPERQANILKIYDEISKKYPNFDSTTCESLIYGIICTKEWKKSLELLEITKLSANPSINMYSLIITKAFQNDIDHDLGWKLLLEMVKYYKKQPKCEIFISYLKWIQQNKEFKKQIDNLNRLLQFIGDFEIVISKNVINNLKKTLHNMKLECSETNILFNGKCQNCNLFLERVFITNDEFNKIRNEFLERVLIRKDIFLKSNPIELEKFLKYIDKHAPYHCIIDGLNVAYSMKGKQAPEVVCSVIRYFKDLNMNVLLIGRKHMSKWPTQYLTYIKKNSKMFLTDDLSQDDPFLLYAALKSGPSTHIFSRDLMRSHLFLLGHDLKNIFKKWLQEHLYSLIKIKRDGKILVKEPSKYNNYAHKVNENWHIPYREIYQANPKESYDVPKNWLCIKTSSKLEINKNNVL